jgi:hypothetical protein
VVSRILEQYGPLRLYFTDAVSPNDTLAAENILSKLNNPVTKLFFQFLEFALPFFTNLNKEMQSEIPKLHLLYKNVCNVLKTIFDCFIDRDYLQNTSIKFIHFKNPRNNLPLETMYFGANVIQTISENEFTEEQLKIFRLRCLDFYVETCSQILQRFPLENNILENLNFLDPQTVKTGSIASISHISSIFHHLISTNLQHVDTGWRLLRNCDEIQTFLDEIMMFWQQVKEATYGDKTPMFSSLSDFVFN